MRVELKMYPHCGTWFKSVAERAERKNSKGNRAPNMDKSKEEAKHKSGVIENVDKSQAMERRYASYQGAEEGCMPKAKSGNKSEGWKEPWQVGQDVQEKNPRRWTERKVKVDKRRVVADHSCCTLATTVVNK